MKLCQNPKGCRKVATKIVQVGHYEYEGEITVSKVKSKENAILKVDREIELCAYCASDFVENYRQDNVTGFARIV